MLRYIIILFFLSLAFLYSVKSYNRYEILKDKFELEIIKKHLFISNNKIIDEHEILRIRNLVKSLSKYPYKNRNRDKINVLNVFKDSSSSCYEKSLLLYKAYSILGIKARPVYVYFNKFGNKTSLLDFFSKRIESHSVIQIYFKNKWVVIDSEIDQSQLFTIDEYIDSGKSLTKKSKYIIGLSNRHGSFISPSFIPDVY